MKAYEPGEEIYDFPLSINLQGEELWLMVKAAGFTGGMLYTVRGEGIATLHILCTYDGERKDKNAHFTVMNEDTCGDAIVTAILQALGKPSDDDDLPDAADPG